MKVKTNKPPKLNNLYLSHSVSKENQVLRPIQIILSILVKGYISSYFSSIYIYNEIGPLLYLHIQ